MIFHPPILALLGASAIAAVFLVGAAVFAVAVLRHWDLSSGSERQIGLERTTHLVSTAVGFVLTIEAASLVLFAFQADRMAPLFVGAMCAVGTLQANVWGFPALWAKILVFFAAFVWVAVDRADGRTRDHALIRAKHVGLLLLAPLVLAEGAIELAYFAGLRANTITSCCGKLFGEDKPDLGGDLASFDPMVALWLLGGTLAVAIGLGLVASRRRRVAVAHGLASLVVFAVALTAIVSAIAPYVYEQPHHHCPFCILKAEYGHVGFALYLPLFIATGAGLASAMLSLLRPARDVGAIAGLARTATLGHVAFAVVALVLVLTSGLTLAV